MKNDRLDPLRLRQTLAELRLRIEERFPGSGLAGVASQLHEVATESDRTLAWIERPSYGLRSAVGFVIALLLALLAAGIAALEVDAHQLTKDPGTLGRERESTAHSPKRTLSAYQLSRYLDYCSELLALTGKVGFLYVQSFDDPEANAAAGDLEQLTTGLARKVWQKVMLLHSAPMPGG